MEKSHEERERELGVFELYESYFGAKRIRGKRGRGAAGKTPVFGLLKRDGKIFVTVVPIYHSENEFARGKPHVNGIECFWSYAKRRMSKFNGLSDENFVLHLKESECRYNHRLEDFAAFVRQIFFEK